MYWSLGSLCKIWVTVLVPSLGLHPFQILTACAALSGAWNCSVCYCEVFTLKGAALMDFFSSESCRQFRMMLAELYRGL